MPSNPWKKPKTKEEIKRVLRKLRDAFISGFIFRIDRDYPYVFSFDGKEPDRPVEVFWDISIEDSAIWSDRYGCIGRTFVAIEKGCPIAMMQVGGVIVPESALNVIPPDIPIITRHVTSGGKRSKVVLAALTVDYFLTSRGVESYGRGPAGEPQLLYKDTVKNPKNEWHSVDNVNAWKAVIERMARRNSLPEDKLKKIRESQYMPKENDDNGKSSRDSD
jgi:hypothetical protein